MFVEFVFTDKEMFLPGVSARPSHFVRLFVDDVALRLDVTQRQHVVELSLHDLVRVEPPRRVGAAW